MDPLTSGDFNFSFEVVKFNPKDIDIFVCMGNKGQIFIYSTSFL